MPVSEIEGIFKSVIETTSKTKKVITLEQIVILERGGRILN